MINSKKLLSIVCVFAIVVSMFSAITVSAATIPAANLNIEFNKTESTKSNLVFDVTTDAEYLSAASIVMDITPIWSMISGSNFTGKGNTIKAVSTFGSSISSNVSENAATAKFTCLTSKKLKIQLAASTTALPYDFTETNVVAKIVIPLTAELTEDVTLSMDAASTFLAAGVADDTSDSGYAFADQYLNAGAMTMNATSWTISFAAPAPADPEVTPDEGTIEAGETADAKTWAVAVDGGLVAAGDKLIATLTNSNFTGEDATQVVELTVDGVDGGADWAFNLKVRFKDVAQRAATTLAIAKAN